MITWMLGVAAIAKSKARRAQRLEQQRRVSNARLRRQRMGDYNMELREEDGR